MASTKKKQDEKHLKSLREMVALPHNKQCFDCHQRGPTYVNMTIGSYVCTACSGLLRGLNPPHRVKSISMASFTPEEMEFLQMHGNEYCRKVWLGLYDNRLGNQAESRDETKVKEFMAQKYERKRYYVAPTDSMKEEARRMNEAGAVVKPPPGTRPLKSLLGENAPKLQVGAQDGQIVTPSGSTDNLPDLNNPANQMTGEALFGDALTNENAPTEMSNGTTGEMLFGSPVKENSFPTQSSYQDLFGSGLPVQAETSGAGENLFAVGQFSQAQQLGAAAVNAFGAGVTSQVTTSGAVESLIGFGPSQQTQTLGIDSDAFGVGLSSQGPTFGAAENLFGVGSSQQGNTLGSEADLFGSEITSQSLTLDSAENLFGSGLSLQNHTLGTAADMFNLQGSIPQEVKPPVSKPAMTSVPSFGSTPQSPGTASLQSTHSTGSNALDLLGDLGGDPFGSTTASAAHSHNTGGFADFGSFGGSVSSQPATFHQSTPLQPLGSAPQSSQAVFNGFPPPPSSAPHAPGAGGDKYSNLSDLFSVSETPEESSIKTGWSSTLSTSGGGGISWNSSSSNSTGGINWGGESNNTSSSGGINWNSQPAASSTSSGGWGGGSTSTSSSSWGGAPVSTQSNGLGAPGNPFLSANVANPFGGGMTATSTSHGQTQQANPFGGQGLGTGFGGFGAPQTQQAGGFGHGQFGAAPGSTGAGFGQFGGVQPANAMPAAGFGQFPTQNGGFGMNTSTSGYPGGQGQMSTAGQASFSSQGFGQAAQGFSGAQQGQHGFGSQGFGAPQVSQQGFGMPQQGYGGQMQQGFGGAGWGGVASAPQANPFMSTAQQYSAPKTGATNPFL
ncbi:arf-GAP domain and FG repeat-containing protein 1-like isoform X1 [Dreissena polymorpha]|uniref:arf-GAP domain and FG repeat-containing protein 1-like isoform X1 n=1 Tax=Dreissena polymorpha TaxID=45954 RepID=UPI0022653CF3|nr:arf-GAP domain and FG repeat-containing protein 1-like isoform X1 [Dreissena polymorpha]